MISIPNDVCIRIINSVEGDDIGQKLYERNLIPPCFGNSDIDYGTCNPNVPFRESEESSHLCVLYHSCLVAHLVHTQRISYDKACRMSYEELCAVYRTHDHISPNTSSEDDRNKLRYHVEQCSLQSPQSKPFRKNSARCFAFKQLCEKWISYAELRKRIQDHFPQCNPDCIIRFVTGLDNQERFGYRVIEHMGQYKIVQRQAGP